MLQKPLSPLWCPHPKGKLVRENTRLLVICTWCEDDFTLVEWRDFHDLPRTKDINLTPDAGKVVWIRHHDRAYGYATEAL